jgi:hypothetical protein
MPPNPPVTSGMAPYATARCTACNHNWHYHTYVWEYTKVCTAPGPTCTCTGFQAPPALAAQARPQAPP